MICDYVNRNGSGFFSTFLKFFRNKTRSKMAIILKYRYKMFKHVHKLLSEASVCKTLSLPHQQWLRLFEIWFYNVSTESLLREVNDEALMTWMKISIFKKNKLERLLNYLFIGSVHGLIHCLSICVTMYATTYTIYRTWSGREHQWRQYLNLDFIWLRFCGYSEEFTVNFLSFFYSHEIFFFLAFH